MFRFLHLSPLLFFVLIFFSFNLVLSLILYLYLSISGCLWTYPGHCSALWGFCSLMAVECCFAVQWLVLVLTALFPCSVLLVCILLDLMFAVQIHAKLSAAAAASRPCSLMCPGRPLAVQVGIGDNAVCAPTDVLHLSRPVHECGDHSMLDGAGLTRYWG